MSYFRKLCPFHGMSKDTSSGLERWIRYCLIALRLGSTQYMLLSLFPDEPRNRRDGAVDASVVVQLVIVGLLWWSRPETMLDARVLIAVYLLFCLFLSLANIIFFSAVPSVNRPSTSPARSLMLLAVNILQVTFTYAVLYEARLNMGRRAALFGSFLVLGTLGVPPEAGTTMTFLVPAQTLSDLVMLLFGATVFVNQFRIEFRKSPDAS
jgi:hypothetical protein